MKSKANIKGHPIHPILIAFPVVFFTSTLISDVSGLLSGSGFLWQMGKYLTAAGIISGLLAAVPGVIDFIFTVPPKSSAKNRAAKHGLINVTMLIVFTIALFYRTNDFSIPVILLEIAGVILLSIAGWMGGTLVSRNQIGIDPRYANAGKWKEAYLKQSTGLLEVAACDELKENQMKLLHIGSKRIVLARNGKGYVAFDDRCTHRGGSLAGGSMICGTVQCPWHGSQFDAETGELKAGPASENISVYPVSEKDGNVYLLL